MRSTLVRLVLQATAVAMLVFLMPLLSLVSQRARDGALANARFQAAAIVPALVIIADPGELVEAAARTEAGSAGRLTLYPPAGDPVGAPRATPEDVRDVAVSRLAATRDVPGRSGGSSGVVYLQPVEVGGGAVAVVEVFVPEADLRRGVHTVWVLLVVVALTLVLGSAVVADRFASRQVRAVTCVTTAMRRFGQAEVSVRVEPTGPRELAALGRAFNTMADRLVGLMRAEQQRTADLAHRLRTPLTALQLKLESLDDSPDTDQVRRAATALSDNIDEVIRAAHVCSTEHLAVRCNLTEVLAERLAFWAVLAEDHDRPWGVIGGTAPLWVQVPRAEAAAAADALLGNVFHHTPEGTAFRAGVFGTTLVVEDDGPGIVDSDSASRRGTSSRGSTGLGLDIARRMAVAAGGTLVITRGASGGARVEVRLPPDATGPPPT